MSKGKKIGKIILKVLLGIVIAVAVIALIIAIVNIITVKSDKNFIKSIDPVQYEAQLQPKLDDDGYYTFTTDENMKVLQLTDVHIGGGMLSSKKDIMAINAVAAMVNEEKPDLVIVTGDIAYPVPFSSGTFNNRNGAVVFADLMEQLGVYWCLAFGNHDTEAYSYYTRADISKVYSNKEKYPHCLYQAGPDDVDGYGNYIIKEKNTVGETIQAYVMIDTHSYVDNDILGILWKYDCTHENQISWYESEIKRLTEENLGKTPKSLMFFHMPVMEMQEAYYEYRDNGFKDTENAKYLFGKAGEKDAVVYSSALNYGLFDKCLELGSTQGMYFGHDHLNNFSISYKGIQMTYGHSIDYLAYIGISKYGLQRGCTVINVHQDGSFDTTQENYYQDKYKSVNQKESVSMEDMYDLSE